MTTLRNTLLTIFCILASTAGIQARNFQTIGVKEGLTDNSIQSITKDSHGYMWFATNDGLDQYDGYVIKKYSLLDYGLYFDTFRYVAEDKGGNLWIKSAVNHIYLYNREEDCLTDDLSGILNPMGIPESHPLNVFVDTKRNLWVETDDMLYCYDYHSDGLFKYDLPEECYSIASNGSKSFVSFRNGDIMQLTPEKKYINKESHGYPVRIYLDSMERLWAFGHSAHSPKYYTPSDGKWRDMPRNHITEIDNVNSILDDRKGRIWFGSESNGLFTYSYDFSDFQTITHESENSMTIPSNHISCIYLSNDNIMWVGTAKSGAALTSLDRIEIEKIPLGISEDVGTIIEDKDGNLLIGLDGKGLLSQNSSGSIKRYSRFEGGTIPSENIVGSSTLSDGTVVFSTYGGGVFKWSEGRSSRLVCKDEKFYSCTRYTRDVKEDNNGNIWIITFSEGIACLMPNGEWKHFTMSSSELMSNYMTSLTYSKKHDRMFASNRECIYEIDTKTFSLKKLYNFKQVTNIFLDDRCILWIGTTEGLYYTNIKSDNQMNRIDMSDGLSNPQIMGIAADPKGNIWVTTNDGFTYIYIIDDPLKESIETRCYPFYKEDGIGEGTFSNNAIWCTSDGNMMLGNDGKVIKVKTNSFTQLKTLRSLAFTNVSLSGNVINLSNPEEFDPKVGIHARYNDNLTINVSAMDYIDRNKIKYEYSLDDSSEWVLMLGNMIFLNRLSPGPHNLDIRIAGTDNYPENSIRLKINVTPPFWKSYFAMGVYMLLLLGLIIVIINMFRSRNRKILDQERHEMDEARIQFFTNISHDLRTPLTMIITPLSKLMRDNKGTAIEKDLVLINRSAMTLMDEVNQLLDFKKIDKQKVSYTPIYGDFVKYIEELLSSFDMVFADDSIKLTSDLCEGPLMMDFDKNKIMRILHNLLSNAFKFNHPSGYVKVTVQKVEDYVELIVADSGSGIDEESKKHIFERFYQGSRKDSLSGNGIGLHIVYEYVRMHGGQIAVSDNHPSGSIFTVILPVTHNAREDEAAEIAAPAEVQEEMPQEEEKIVDDKPHILIVEDNLPFRKFLKSSLSEKYKVYEAGNGIAALESLEKHSIGIIISDVMMPEMDGTELCREVKNDIRYSHIPIILLTAIQNKDMVVKGLKDGADEYISKPFDVEVLTLKIDNLLKWRAENHDGISNREIKANELTISKIDEELMKKTIAAIENNLSNSEYSVEDLSLEVGISRSGLYKKLMFITGKSPIEFIRVIKLKKGKEMLDEGETSVSQIAWSVGFSPKQFSKYFKDEYGCLPSEYMKHLRNGF